MNKPLLAGPPFEPVKMTKGIKSVFSHAGFIGFTFLAVSQVCSYFTALVFALSGLDTDSGSFIFFASCAQYIIGYPVCLLTAATMTKAKPEKRKIKFRYIPAGFAVCITLGAAGMYLGNYFSAVINLLFGKIIADPLQSSIPQMSLLQNILMTALICPIFEELIFRKAILDRTGSYGNGPAVFVSALVFALVHCNIYQFFYAFLIGLFFAYIYVKTGKIAYSIVLHMLFNFFGGVLPSLFSSLNADSAAEYMKNLISGNIETIISLLYIFLYYSLLISGIVIICVLSKKVKKDFSDYSHELGKVFAPAILNCGMVFVFILSTGILVINSLFTA